MIKEILIDLLVVSTLALMFAGALHIHSGCHPEEHRVSFSASAHGR